MASIFKTAGIYESAQDEYIWLVVLKLPKRWGLCCRSPQITDMWYRGKRMGERNVAAIKIDMKKIRSVNYNLPPMVSNLSAQKRYVNMLKWRIPAEIQDRKNIRERLNSVLRELDRAQQQINDIYKATESAMEQYLNMETNLTVNASRFQ